MLDCEEEYNRMERAEEVHWWYQCLHALVIDELNRMLIQPSSMIVDAGCGTGGLLLRLQQAGYRVRGFDVSPYAVERSRRRGLQVDIASIAELRAHILPASLVAIICADVLYYLTATARVETLKSWHHLLIDRGNLILNVPTGELFRGIHDVSVGISERIRLRQLVSELGLAGYEVLSWRYWPFVLSPIIMFARLRQRSMLRRGKAEIRSDIDLLPAPLNWSLQALTRLEHRLPIGWFGSSLFVVAKAKHLPVVICNSI